MGMPMRSGCVSSFVCPPRKVCSLARDRRRLVPPLGGGMETRFSGALVSRYRAQSGIIQVKVDGLERSKQQRNMHRLSTCNRGRRVTDTVPQTRRQISEVRRARADPFRAIRHAARCTHPPQAHSWTTPPPQGTATCDMGVHRQPKGVSSHNRARPQPFTSTHRKVCNSAPATKQSFPLPPYDCIPPADTRPARSATVAAFRVPCVGIMTSSRSR